MTEPEPVWLEWELWQDIKDALKRAESLPEFKHLSALANRIGKETWLGDVGEMIQIAADPAVWDAALVCLDIDDPPVDGKKTLGWWLLKQRACARKSRETAAAKRK